MKIINYTKARDTLRSVLDSVIGSKPVIVKSKASAVVLIEYNQYCDLVDIANAHKAKNESK